MAETWKEDKRLLSVVSNGGRGGEIRESKITKCFIGCNI